jgi:hypothetical protein
MEGGDSLPVIRRVLGMVEGGGGMWRYEVRQEQRAAQYREGVRRVERRLRVLDILDPLKESVEYSEERVQLEKRLVQFKLVIDYIRPLVRGTLHPNGDCTSTSTSSTRLFDGWRIRGIHVRFAGPRKATKAGHWTRSAGAISLNSYAFVDGEEANVQVPSRTGTYGLTVRVVWGLQKGACGVQSVFSDGVYSYTVF